MIQEEVGDTIDRKQTSDYMGRQQSDKSICNNCFAGSKILILVLELQAIYNKYINYIEWVIQKEVKPHILHDLSVCVNV